MAFDGTGKVEIPGEEIWEWLHEQWIPDLEGAEIAFGRPRWDEENGQLVIDYAYSTSCHPADWAEPPEWLKKEEDP